MAALAYRCIFYTPMATPPNATNRCLNFYKINITYLE